MNRAELTLFVKKESKRLGFEYCGISAAGFLEEEARPLEEWLKAKHHGEMSYMERNFDKRLDPRILVPGAKTVVSLLYNYGVVESSPASSSSIHSAAGNKRIGEQQKPKIATYAFGEDYHVVVKNKLYELLASLSSQAGPIEGRCFVDSAPVLERAWAKKSGLGWVGKNSMLIHPKAGSYYFLAEIISDLPLEPDNFQMQDYCGTCNKCVEACPTQALFGNKTIEADKCISYFTIELKKEFDSKVPNFTDWIFGCDICQQVCPWNRFAKQNNEPLFKPLEAIAENDYSNWLEITEDTFQKVFNKSPLKRAGLEGIKRNIRHVLASGQVS